MAPRLGGELPPYTTMGAKPKKPRKVMAFPNPLASTGSGKNVVQRAPRVSTGMPGTKNFVQRMPGGAHQRKPGAGGMARVMGTLRSVLTAPRKPAK